MWWILQLLNSHNSVLYHSLCILLYVSWSSGKISKTHSFWTTWYKFFYKGVRAVLLKLICEVAKIIPRFEFGGYFLSEWRWPCLYHITKHTPATYSDTRSVLTEGSLHVGSNRHVNVLPYGNVVLGIFPRVPCHVIFREYEIWNFCIRTCQELVKLFLQVHNRSLGLVLILCPLAPHWLQIEFSQISLTFVFFMDA